MEDFPNREEAFSKPEEVFSKEKEAEPKRSRSAKWDNSKGCGDVARRSHDLSPAGSRASLLTPSWLVAWGR
jgi:hypothetical protein